MKKTGQTNSTFKWKSKIKRPGRHSKKASLNKNSKTYVKLYVQQG